MAICVSEVLRELDSSRAFGVTDISLNALSKACNAVYGALRLERMDANLCERYFLARDNGWYRIVPDLAARLRVARLNVLELAKALQFDMDVIFCQSLLTHFRRWRCRKILNCLAERLVPEGDAGDRGWGGGRLAASGSSAGSPRASTGVHPQELRLE